MSNSVKSLSRDLGVTALVFGALALAPSPAAAQISTVDTSYSPAVLTVPAGTEVTWTIGSGHDLFETTGDNCTVYSEGFSSGSGSFSHVFDVPGTYYYMCSPHCAEGMKGRVIVLPDPSGTGGASGSGGDSSSGGESATGGESSSGGDSSSGGESASGGDTASGGESASGGDSGEGGDPVAGGGGSSAEGPGSEEDPGAGAHGHSSSGGRSAAGDGSGGDEAGSPDGSEGLGGDAGTDSPSNDGGDPAGGGCALHAPRQPASFAALVALSVLGLGVARRRDRVSGSARLGG